MALKFGTSGVRGLVTEMTDRECYLYSRAFARHLAARSEARKISVAGDYRRSTPRIMRSVCTALAHEEFEVENCGFIPTGAVTARGIAAGRGSVMVTGSHIPDDRNGIKFNMPWGEVLKADETEISVGYVELKKQDLTGPEGSPLFGSGGDFASGVACEVGGVDASARDDYSRRYVEFFPAGCLAGLKVVVYQHSSVARELIPEVLGALGAETVCVGWSDTFVPVDTEAVQEPERLASWTAEHGAVLVSADGDGDRPLIVDENGRIIRGDVLGIIVADFLGADCVCTPVSCNTALERCGRFKSVRRTRIGSPYVIEAMAEAIEDGFETVVGYEANGGFMTATDISISGAETVLKALPTRDALLPIICALVAGKRAGSVAALTDGLPDRFSASGLLRQFPSEAGGAVVERFRKEGAALAREFFGEVFGAVASIDFTDGARMTFETGDIVHLRPSGNAPEFRCYTESDSEAKAAENNDRVLSILRNTIRPMFL